MIEDLAAHLRGLDHAALSDAAKARLKLCILANLAVGVAGAPYAFPAAPATPGGRHALLDGRGAADARAAAFWNGAAMHARTQDDFDPIGNLHVGTVVLPALLATAGDVAVPGETFLTATLAGYVAAIGLARFASPRTSPRGLRSTGYFSPFGASAAVALAHGLDRDGLASALALTTVFAAGTTQSWIDGGHEWQLHAGHGAETGLRTVAMARAGLKGSPGALSGEAGLFHALMGERPDFADISEGFEPDRVIKDSVIKRFPVSGICQSVVLAAQALGARLTDPAAIAHVTVEMNGFEITYPGTRNAGPVLESFGERLMSAAFCTSSVLACRSFAFEDFHRAENPARDGLIRRVGVVADPALPLLSARVSVALADGRTLSEEVIDSRAAVRIDEDSIRPWGRALLAEIGRPAEDFDRLAEAVATIEARDRIDPRGLLGYPGAS